MYPKAYLDYLIYFHTDRDYFECHEVLEEYWKTVDRSNIWVGLIQIAVGLYHFRRNNDAGAKKMMLNAHNILQNESLQHVGLDKQILLTKLTNIINHINDKQPFQDINLPIIDQQLRTQCEQICHQNNLTWGSPSNLANEDIVHKHKLRDRTEVINEREKQKRLRKNRGK